MYRDEIKELLSLKKESKKLVLNELFSLYFKLKICNLNSEIIKSLIKFYLNYDSEELEILKLINSKFGNIDYNIIIEEILDELDLIYNYYYEYINNIINNYEIIDINLIDLMLNRKKYKDINIKIPVLEKELNKNKIIEKIRSI